MAELIGEIQDTPIRRIRVHAVNHGTGPYVVIGEFDAHRRGANTRWSPTHHSVAIDPAAIPELVEMLQRAADACRVGT